LGVQFLATLHMPAMKRPYATGQLYEKSGSYYGRWRTPDGRRLNRRLGAVRAAGQNDGITRAEAERAFRKVQADEATKSRAKAKRRRAVTVDFAANALRERLAIEGARLSYRQNTESMQRVHVSPALGKRRIETVTRQDVERLAWRRALATSWELRARRFGSRHCAAVSPSEQRPFQ